MPIYEYKCSNCNHIFDSFQRIGADGSELSCPKCGAAKPEKIFSTIAASVKSDSGGYTGASSGCGSSGFS